MYIDITKIGPAMRLEYENEKEDNALKDHKLHDKRI